MGVVVLLVVVVVAVVIDEDLLVELVQFELFVLFNANRIRY